MKIFPWHGHNFSNVCLLKEYMGEEGILNNFVFNFDSITLTFPGKRWAQNDLEIIFGQIKIAGGPVEFCCCLIMYV